MTRVDFYLLPQHDEKSRQIFACRLAEKAWQLDNRTLIQTTDNETGSALNALLWTFKADSFLPHAILPASQQTPVHIGWQGESSSHHDLLINLSADVPTFFSRFARVAEIVTQDELQLSISRQRFRFYQERGYDIKINDMKKAA
ncbi:MAG TPA: DNA polymerase III subunit chi [Pseudomonadales bacterium]|jgi:DNA polymerase-3 subunit chi|nr:DNA polymerase III subunit chi [Pseudomonadales bacterium]HNN86928.1 DNA polymerase III subunit chi [Pseudomonadales bacterium]